MTVLEIGRSTIEYAFSLASLPKIVWIALMLEGNVHEVLEHIKNEHLSNVTVLNPRYAQYDVFFNLSRCEHFDIVIVHDIFDLIQSKKEQLIDVFIKLGDYVFFQTGHKEIEGILRKKRIVQVAVAEQSSLFLSHKPKVSLDIARYTQKDRPVRTHPKYHITSTFTEKLFYKKELEQPTKWVEGINLITFGMLKGIYPDDGAIRRELVGLKKTHADHNDLVLGNIIVQGERLVPIDFHDERRDADCKQCIAAAIHAFKDGNIRHSNPEKWIREYYDSV